MNNLPDTCNDDVVNGKKMYKMAQILWPITRSITGEGVRQTLGHIKHQIPELKIKKVATGTKAFDWSVPEEWNITEAYIEDENGIKILDFLDNNLHVVGYSVSVDTWLTLDGLNEYLHSLPDQPNAIPYVTSYYKKKWGFCLTHKQRNQLKDGKYHAVIKSSHSEGELNYGELILKGTEDKEILLSTYICHPSMGNNELSGPVVTSFLVKWLMSIKNRRFTYRVIFVPETIGSIVYLSKHIKHLKKNVIAGFIVTCIGDNNCYSYLPSRNGRTISDTVAKHVLSNIDPSYKKYSWLDRGSDERQYCAPGVDLPIATIMRSKYGEYPEYHTSLDDLKFISADGLYGGYSALKNSLQILEFNYYPKVTVLCEPQLGKRGLYTILGAKGQNSGNSVRIMMHLISYSDGASSLLDIAEIINVPFLELLLMSDVLVSEGLIKKNMVSQIENK
jgi:aminopeptidase-like protein